MSYLSLEYDANSIRQTISMDIGSGSFKIGYSGDESPLFDLPSLCGRFPRQYETSQSVLESKPDRPENKLFFGDEAILQTSYLNLNYFIQNGSVVNWDNWEVAIHQMFYRKMQVEPEYHPIILNILPLSHKAEKEKATQLMFETFCVPAVYFANSPQMSLFASGRTFGVSLMCGDGVSLVAPFTDDSFGNDYQHTYRMNIGGRDLNDYLLKLVMSRGKCSFTENVGREVMREIKESGYFTCDESEKVTKKYFTLPDGSRIVLEEELKEITEPLFRTELISTSVQFEGIDKMLNHSISNMPIEYRKDLYSNIVLAGGSTLFKGFKDRLEKEMTPLASSQVSIITPTERKHSVWLGQSIYSSLNSFQSLWLTKEAYDESGPSIIGRRPCW